MIANCVGIVSSNANELAKNALNRSPSTNGLVVTARESHGNPVARKIVLCTVANCATLVTASICHLRLVPKMTNVKAETPARVGFVSVFTVPKT